MILVLLVVFNLENYDFHGPLSRVATHLSQGKVFQYQVFGILPKDFSLVSLEYLLRITHCRLKQKIDNKPFSQNGGKNQYNKHVCHFSVLEND